MIEVERKFAVHGLDEIRTKILGAGGSFVRVESHRDQYFTHPHRGFARSGKALRIRSLGDSGQFTFKGPRRRGPAKIREEIDVNIPTTQDVAQLREILLRLGFEPLATVKKHREIFRWESATAPIVLCLDKVDYLGEFVEIESIVDDDDQEIAIAAIEATQLALGLKEPITASYLKMLMSPEAHC